MAYATVQEASEYLTARGLSADGVTDAMLQRGADYIDNAYGARFPGVPTGDAAWPRDGAVDVYGRAVDGVPAAVQNASIVAAYLLSAGTDLQPIYTPGRSEIQRTVGPITIRYAGQVQLPDGRSAWQPVIPEIDGLLSAFLTSRAVPIYLI